MLQFLVSVLFTGLMNNTQEVIFWATVVNAVSVFVLVVVTIWYASSTARILDESRKARKASERQADAAEESLRVLRHQLEEHTGLGRTIVASAIQSARRNIEYWRRANIYNLACIRALPSVIDLPPSNSGSAVEHARRISVDGSGELSSCFDNLRHARAEIEIIRDAHQTSPHFYEQHTQSALKYIELAEVELNSAERYFRERVSQEQQDS